jgi:hypothetical protein
MFREFANISPSFDLESGWRVLMVLFGKVLKQLGLKMLFLFFCQKHITLHVLAASLQTKTLFGDRCQN